LDVLQQIAGYSQPHFLLQLEGMSEHNFEYFPQLESEKVIIRSLAPKKQSHSGVVAREKQFISYFSSARMAKIGWKDCVVVLGMDVPYSQILWALNGQFVGLAHCPKLEAVPTYQPLKEKVRL
jgi:hypothetical protein